MANKVLVSKISEPYADALLELAKANNCTEAVTSDITDILTLMSSVPELPNYLGNPVIAGDKKKEFIKKVLESKVNSNTLKFLQFLIDRRRIAYLDAIGEKFLEQIWELEGTKVVKLQTVIPLSYEQEELLITKLKDVTGFKEIQLVRKIDKEILGGMILQIDSQVIDMSLKGKLRQISNLLGTSLAI